MRNKVKITRLILLDFGPSVCTHRQEHKCVGTHVSKATFKHFPQPIRSHMQSLRTLRQRLKDQPLSAQKSKSAGDNYPNKMILSLKLFSPPYKFGITRTIAKVMCVCEQNNSDRLQFF